MKRKKILFVCTGNTCRSPMAQLILRAEIKKRKIKWWDVSSCGINAEVGGCISENSRIALEEIGINSDNFAPRQLTQKLIESSVLVITMTTSQKQIIEGCGNVVSMKDICGYDIPDPYGCSLEKYRLTRNAIFDACEMIINNYILIYKENL
ncbi:MAG: low molecular weight protein arginine phosphatase [Candidatus Coproplasma sp.]